MHTIIRLLHAECRKYDNVWFSSVPVKLNYRHQAIYTNTSNVFLKLSSDNYNCSFTSLLFCYKVLSKYSPYIQYYHITSVLFLNIYIIHKTLNEFVFQFITFQIIFLCGKVSYYTSYKVLFKI